MIGAVALGFVQIKEISNTLTKVNLAQQGLVPQTIRELLKDTASLTQEDVQRRAELAAALLRAARDQRLESARPALAEASLAIARVGREHENSPSVWKMTAAYVNYRSDLEAKPEVRDLRTKESQLPRCLDKLPFDAGTSISTDRKTATLHGPIVYVGCVVFLDEQKAIGTTVMPGGAIFRRCLVKYGGGQITIRAVFENCLFDVDLSAEPPPEGRRLTDKLIASQTTLIDLSKS